MLIKNLLDHYNKFTLTTEDYIELYLLIRSDIYSCLLISLSNIAKFI